MKKLDLLITGVGGQGIILASDIIAEAALAAGYDVKKTDTLGMAQRGGSVVSHVRIAHRVWSPLIKEGEADMLVAFEKLEAARWGYYLQPGAIVIVNNHVLPPLSVNLGTERYPSDEEITSILRQRSEHIYFVNGTSRVRELGNMRTLNMFMLGCSRFLSRLRFTFGRIVYLSAYHPAYGKSILLPSTGVERKSEVPISERVQKSMAQGSWIRRMFEEGTSLKRQYGEENVFDLSLGNPVMEPPIEFRQELRRLAENPLPGMHRYMENAGYPETRAAVAAQLSLDTGIKFTTKDIIMTCGAAGAINVVLKTILNQGDEVIIFTPYFAEYVNYIDNHGGITRALPTDEQFIPKLDVLETAISSKTKAILINSPNNPSGAVYSENFMHQLGELLHKKETQYGTPIFLISDEAYRKIIYDGLKYPSPLPHHPQSIIATSHSKDLALPGERIGYIAVHPDCSQREELVNGIIHCNRILGYVNAPALMQHIVRHLQPVTVSVTEYQKKRDFLYEHLTEMGYSVIKPRGAFYMFPKSPLEDDVAFVRELQQSRVLTVPGSGFGAPGYFRISYCVDERTLEGSLAGFRKAAQKFNLC